MQPEIQCRIEKDDCRFWNTRRITDTGSKVEGGIFNIQSNVRNTRNFTKIGQLGIQAT